MELMTMPEVAQVLRVPVSRAYELARNNIIPCVRLGRQVRVDRDALREWARGGGKRSKQSVARFHAPVAGQLRGGGPTEANPGTKPVSKDRNR